MGGGALAGAGLAVLLGRYVLFALFPAAVLFNAHQHIAYGAFLGQYYLMGPGAWLTTAAIYWATLCAYLLLYASAWRGMVEAVTLVTPSHAGAVRRVAERSTNLFSPACRSCWRFLRGVKAR